MSGLWDSLTSSLKSTAAFAGSAAVNAASITKAKADILLIDRDITNRQMAFGEELYDYVAPLSKQPDFFAADDMLTNTLRPPLLKAQREIAALELKLKSVRGEVAQAEVKRKASFPTPAVSWTEKVKNAGISTALAANEAKLATSISAFQTQIQHYKQQFGLDLYPTLVELEDDKNWLPTDREIRSLYDNARKDVEKLVKSRKEKQDELVELGVADVEQKDGLTKPHSSSTYETPQVPRFETSTAATNTLSTSLPTSDPFPSSLAPRYTEGSSSYGSTTTTAAPTYNSATTSAAPYINSQPTTYSSDPFADVAPMGTPLQQHDPFAMTTPPQQQQHVDPFAQTTTQQQTRADPFAPAPVSSFGDLFAQAANGPVDPFAASKSNNKNNHNDPFAGL